MGPGNMRYRYHTDPALVGVGRRLTATAASFNPFDGDFTNPDDRLLLGPILRQSPTRTPSRLLGLDHVGHHARRQVPARLAREDADGTMSPGAPHLRETPAGLGTSGGRWRGRRPAGCRFVGEPGPTSYEGRRARIVAARF